VNGYSLLPAVHHWEQPHPAFHRVLLYKKTTKSC
jgi:hypothetical protein